MRFVESGENLNETLLVNVLRISGMVELKKYGKLLQRLEFSGSWLAIQLRVPWCCEGSKQFRQTNEILSLKNLNK